MNSFVYILQSLKTKEYYIGCSDNPEERLKKHNAGHVYATKFKRPYRLLFKQSFDSKLTALKIEKKIKTWKRKDFIDRIISDEEIKITGD